VQWAVDDETEAPAESEDAEAEAQRGATSVAEQQKEWPDEVELLFYREAPEVMEGKGWNGEGHGGQAGEILQEEGVEVKRAEWVALEEHYDGAEDERCVVEREDAQGAADVEVAEEVGFAGGVPEDAGDEEAGEREEELNACPAGGR